MASPTGALSAWGRLTKPFIPVRRSSVTSHYSANSFPYSENESSSESAAEQSCTQPQECILSEAAQKHMQLIGTFLIQIIQEWNARHQSRPSLRGSETEQIPTSSEREI